MKVTICAMIADSNAAARQWLEELLEQANSARPAGVAVTIKKVDESSPEYLTVGSVSRLFRESMRAEKSRYTARATFYWIIDVLAQRCPEIEVICTECRTRYGVCRCLSRGYFNIVDGTWKYQAYDPKSPLGEEHWTVSRASLIANVTEALLDEAQPNISRRTHISKLMLILRVEASQQQ
jgi:hypothetical protein